MSGLWFWHYLSQQDQKVAIRRVMINPADIIVWLKLLTILAFVLVITRLHPISLLAFLLGGGLAIYLVKGGIF